VTLVENDSFPAIRLDTATFKKDEWLSKYADCRHRSALLYVIPGLHEMKTPEAAADSPHAEFAMAIGKGRVAQPKKLRKELDKLKLATWNLSK
jgi:hypothetical protein